MLILWDKRIGERLHGRILPAVMHQLKGRTKGLGHLNVVAASLHIAEVSDNGKDFGRHVVSVTTQTCTCEEWQHTGQPSGHALPFLTIVIKTGPDREKPEPKPLPVRST